MEAISLKPTYVWAMISLPAIFILINYKDLREKIK